MRLLRLGRQVVWTRLAVGLTGLSGKCQWIVVGFVVVVAAVVFGFVAVVDVP